MLCYFMRIFFFTIFAISKCIPSNKELLLEISSHENGKLFFHDKNKNNEDCSKNYAMVIKNMYVEKENKQNKDNNCQQDLRVGNKNNRLLQLLAFNCNGNQQCRPEYFLLDVKPILSCNGTDVEADLIRIIYICKPFDEPNVWKFSSKTKKVQLTEKFYMQLESNEPDHHTCKLLSNNNKSHIQILHLKLNQGNENYLFLKGSGDGIEITTVNKIIMESVIVAGDMITMEIKSTKGFAVWLELQASCGTNITCYTHKGESGRFERRCDETTGIADFSEKYIIRTNTSSSTDDNSTVSTNTSSLTEEINADEMSIKDETSTYVTSSITDMPTVTSFSTEGMTYFTNVIKDDKTASSLSNEELYTVVIVCAVLAVVVLLVIVALVVVYTRRRKHRSIPSNNHSPSDPYLDNTYSNPAVAYTEVCTFKKRDELPESNVTSQPGTEYSEPAPTPENHIVSQPKDTYATVNKPNKSIPEPSNDINGSTPETTRAVEVPSALHLESEYSHLSSVHPKVPTETENIYNG